MSKTESYECLICMNLCNRPIKCQRCPVLLCHQHLFRLHNRCPHCRLEPFLYAEQPMIQREILVIKRLQKERQKSENVFKCLVEGCSFEGRYPQMLVHRRSRHFDFKIDQILFHEDKENKKKRDALKRLFLSLPDHSLEKYHAQAVNIYAKTKGRCGMVSLKRFLKHLEQCKHAECARIEVGEQWAYIGVESDGHVRETTCKGAKMLKCRLD